MLRKVGDELFGSKRVKAMALDYLMVQLPWWSVNWSTHMFMDTANNISKIRFWIQATIPKHSQRRGKIRNNEGF